MRPRLIDRLPGGVWTVGVGVSLAVLLISAGVWSQVDLDGDGLDGAEELSLGTDPLRADTDGDRLPDGFEQARGLDPFHPDTDRDTLDDRPELHEGTDPRHEDTDRDGLNDRLELALNTSAVVSDTDGDRLPDGLESDLGTDPTRADSEGDGVDDSVELLVGAGPWIHDTDQDGLSDRAEVDAGARDCNGDGVTEVAQTDDDADHRPDADEPPEHRCTADVDGDGILDGEERNVACIERPDCDEDGLGDGTEEGTEFDRLDPDTFDVGLLDGVSWAFKQRGQPPSQDADADGIPDAWERTTGLIDWGPFDPQPGRRDLLVEFVRVEGPDSSRLGPGPLTPAYEDVEAFFEREGGITLGWTSSRVLLEEEVRPPLIPSNRASYYRDVLARADHAANPYVTTVVMNPQHNMSEIAHLGVAPIRGMLAAVDYGAHSKVEFRVGNQTFTLSPMLESLVVAGRDDILSRSGFTDSGRTERGDLFVETPDWRMTWGPFWFSHSPTFTFEDGSTVRAARGSASVDHQELADTIAHELGHTLGLCHTDLPSCQANLSQADREQSGVSTMDQRRRGPTLAFLASEWGQVRTYLTCPPQRPIALLAEGANRSAVIEAKYEITLENVLDVRTRDCEDRRPLPSTLGPDRSPVTVPAYATLTPADLTETPEVYRAPPEDRPPAPASRSAVASVAYGLVSLGISAAVGGSVALAIRWRPG